jgi:hypothetical protein
MTRPSTPDSVPSSAAPCTPAGRNVINDQKRRNSRQYALSRFDFDKEPVEIDVLAYHEEHHHKHSDARTQLQDRAIRYYGSQTLSPGVLVSPCMDATNRARRMRRARIRESADSDGVVGGKRGGVFCDITGLLRDAKPKRSPKTEDNGENKAKPESVIKVSADSEWTDDKVVDENDISELLSSEDEVEKEYEVLDGERFGSEHNGRERRWYRGFRHER